MTPHYSDDWLTVYHGDARAAMAELPPESVHCVVTSPPYWGLRDYGTAEWIGGDEACDHEPDEEWVRRRYLQASGLAGKDGIPQTQRNAARPHWYAQTPGFCPRCGAIRQDSQLGLEPTPEQYVENMVAVFREVRRVLRSDGTVWLNLGDSYAGSWGNQGRKPERGEQRPINGPMLQSFNGYPEKESNTGAVPPGLKPKDLVGIPWRVAFALQADGWYLRSDIIWSKPNPMPESVTDRPTKSHEYLFLLSKSARYFYDAEAIREPMKEVSLKRLSQPNVFDQPGGPKDPMTGNRSHRKAINNQAERLVKHEKWKTRFEGWDEYDKSLGRNLRSVWSIATAPYPGAHFATFPPKLVEPCIKAGSPEGGVVLDCFAGSGTTGMVAQSLSRRAILIDLSMDYLDQLMQRNREVPLGL